MIHHFSVRRLAVAAILFTGRGVLLLCAALAYLAALLGNLAESIEGRAA